MQDGKHYARLGVFVVVSIVVLAAGLFVVGARQWFQPTFEFETYFDQSVAGLDVGAPVRYRGVPLGHVTGILTSAATYEQFVPIAKRRQYIVVRVEINVSGPEATQMRRDAEALVDIGLRAQTQLAGITGQQYLSVDFLNPKNSPRLPFDWAPKYFYVPSAPSEAGEIIAKAQSFLANLNEADIKSVGQGLSKLVNDLDLKLNQIPVAALTSQVQTTLESANGTLSQLKVVLQNPALIQTVENAAAVTGRIRQLTQDGQVDRLVTDLDDASQRLNALIGDNQYEIRGTVQDLRTTAGNLRVLSETLKRYPAGVLIGGPPEKLHLPGTTP